MLTINKKTNKVFNLKEQKIISNHSKYALLWKMKYNVKFAKKEDNMEEKIMKFIKS